MIPLDDLARLLVETWNRGDARAFARLFTPSAEYITGTGERFRGPQAIARLLETAAPQVRLLEAPQIQRSAEFAQLSFAWSALQANSIARRGRITCACVRHESGWLIERLNNEEAATESPGSPTTR